MASLDSVKLKIGWAKEHSKALEVEMTRYFNGNPCHVVAKVDAKLNQLVSHLEITAPVPDPVALIVGDCLQNLRSALDYLVWELALAADTKPKESNAFPICASPKAFKDEIRRGRLFGVSEDARALIESAQPYHGGDLWEATAPWVLNQLTNINKHRRVLLTILNPFFTNDPGIASTEPGRITRTPGRGPEKETQARLVRRGGKVEVDAMAVVNIVFNERMIEGHDVTQVLANITDWIENKVLPPFEGFF